MDLIKLLDISNPKGLRSIINTVITEHNQNVEDVAAVKQQIDSTIPDALADRYTKSEVQALLEANQRASDAYTNAKIATLIDSAPETLDTFAEIAAAFAEDQAVLDALNSAIGLKANKTELDNYYTKTASDALLNNKYVKPAAGIPKTDLASDVQTSLDKADSALQALPEFKTINNESILGSGNINLTASDVGALPDSTVIPTSVNNMTGGTIIGTMTTSNTVIKLRGIGAAAYVGFQDRSGNHLGSIGVRSSDNQAVLSNDDGTFIVLTEGNTKTINGESLYGSGNIEVAASGGSKVTFRRWS